MPRVTFAEMSAASPEIPLLLIPRPQSVPEGYTPVILVTEWLTLNCRGDWACSTVALGLRVRFADPVDRARAAARFVSHPEVVVGLSRPVRRRPARRRSVAA